MATPIARDRTVRAIVLHCFFSFVICSIDRINLSVAIIPMSVLFQWTSSQQGLIQSIFYLGYMTTMILGGRIADSHGGRPVLALGVFIWSLCTILTPLCAPSFSLLLLIRVLLGAGEGVAMPAMNALVASHVPSRYRARALSFIYSGMYFGSILGLVITPSLLAFGYGAAFYVYAFVGIIWVFVFLATTRNASKDVDLDPESTALLHPSHQSRQPIKANVASEEDDEEDDDDDDCSNNNQALMPPTLYEMMTCRAVWAINIAHFCCTWGYFVLLAWMPTYLFSRFSLDITSSSLLSALPFFAMVLSSNLGGVLADWLLRRGVGTTRVRKWMQGIGFAGPAVLLTIVSVCNHLGTNVVLLAGSLALAAFSHSGVYSNHQDVGPDVAGTLLGISNSFASIPGLVGVWLTGVALELTDGSWAVVFWMAVFCYVVGFVVYTSMATADRIW